MSGYIAPTGYGVPDASERFTVGDKNQQWSTRGQIGYVTLAV